MTSTTGAGPAGSQTCRAGAGAVAAPDRPDEAPRLWDLDDLAGTGDLAAEFGVSRATVCAWVERYADFPALLTTLSGGPVRSRAEVREWHDARIWKGPRQRRK